MSFKVEMSELAQEQYENILSYLAYKIRNPQAVEAVIDDFDFAVEQLENNADVFGFCNSPRLKALGLYKLHFQSTDI